MFLNDVLPDLTPQKNGFLDIQPAYFAFGLSPDGKTRQIPCFSKKELVVACGHFEDDGWNSYFAQAAFGDYLLSRRANNATALRCLFADIDVGKKNNSYATAEEAEAGIVEFVQKTKLQPSYIVRSGMGYYVYWCFNQDVKVNAWRKLAVWLAEIMRREGLIFDPACTCDPARVLRMPGTTHVKSGRRVEILAKSGRLWGVQQLAERMLATAPPSWVGAPAEVPLEKPVPENALFSNPFDTAMTQPPRAYAEPIVRGCKQIELAGLGTEPQWYAMMSVLKRCVDGREWAHTISAKDRERYDEYDTDRKFDHAPDDAPARCTTFETLNASLCALCPHRGKLTSPVQLWKRSGGITTEYVPEQETGDEASPEPEQPADTEPPARLTLPFIPEHTMKSFTGDEFYVADDGCHWVEVKETKMGLQTYDHVITRSRLYYVKTKWTYHKGVSVRNHGFVVINPNGHRETVWMNAAIASSQQQLMSWFYSSNVFPAAPQYKAGVFMAFMNAYLNSLLNNSQIDEVSTMDTFGWREADEDTGRKAGFATGSGFITAEGIEDVSYTGVAEKLAQGLGARGTIEGWKPAVNLYKTLDQKAAQLGVCLAFAAPLMKYGSCVATSATFSLWSARSGMGKTQFLRACASVWGNPDGQWIQRNSSTVARMRHLAVLNNIPAFMDELTDVSDDDLYALAYSLVGGQEKNKLRRNGVEMAETGTWNTVTFCTSNKSIKEAVANKAGDSSASITRVIEYECDFQSYADDPRTTAYINDCIAACASNYGLAGPNFVYNLLRHADRLPTLTSTAEHWACAHGFGNDERFLSYPLALALIAGRWAVEWGLLDYDMNALEQWVLNMFVPHNRRRTNEQVKSSKTLLLTYLTDRQRNLLVVKSDERTSQMPAPNMPDLEYVYVRPQHSDVLLRMTADEHRLYIIKADLHRWCKRIGRSPASLIRSLSSEGVHLRQLHYNLGRNVPSLSMLPIVECYFIDTDSVLRLGFNPVMKPAAPENLVLNNV